MLSVRISPSLAKFAQLRYASYQPVLGTIKLTSCCIEKGPNRITATGVEHGQIAISSNFITYRSYASDPKPPSLPSKKELQTIFFKVTVVIWDLCRTLILYAWTMFKKHVIYNPNVQLYWTKFNKKLDEARKN